MTVRQRILPSVSQLHQSAAFVTFHHHSIIMGDDNPDWIMRGCAICSGIMVFIILFLTIAYVVLVCATVIPYLAQIDSNTEDIEDVNDSVKDVEDSVDRLHGDLKTMIDQLNLAAALLTNMDANIAIIAGVSNEK